eukprot:scaffold15271_cov110-Isochrysis_galbana.AAC.7
MVCPSHLHPGSPGACGCSCVLTCSSERFVRLLLCRRCCDVLGLTSCVLLALVFFLCSATARPTGCESLLVAPAA